MRFVQKFSNPKNLEKSTGFLMLSPVPSFTSEPTPSPPKPPIFLISSLRSCYLLISLVLFPFIPASLSVRPFPICYAIMLTQPHVPVIAPPPELRTRSSSRTPIPVPAPPLDSELLPVFKPAVSIDTTQSDYRVSYVTFCLIL